MSGEKQTNKEVASRKITQKKIEETLVLKDYIKEEDSLKLDNIIKSNDVLILNRLIKYRRSQNRSYFTSRNRWHLLHVPRRPDKSLTHLRRCCALSEVKVWQRAKIGVRR